MSFVLKVTPRTENRKLTNGAIGVAATMRPVGDTCPKSCPFLDNGCYAQRGPLSIIQKKSANDRHELEKILETDVKLVRHHVSGDFFRNGRLDVGYLDEVISFHHANPQIVGWAYTHAWKSIHNAGYRVKKLPPNLTLIASVENRKDDALAKSWGWRTAMVVEDFNEWKRGDIRCLAQLTNNKITCSTCQLCWSKDSRIKSVLFKRH